MPVETKGCHRSNNKFWFFLDKFEIVTHASMYEAGYLHLRIPSIRLENQHKSEIVHAKRLARCQGIRQMGVIGRTLTILNHLFAGIPIFNALRFIININATMLNEIIAPTRNIELNAVAFGTVETTPEVFTSVV